jgi:transcriptional regulator with XRE-family HTH domain
MTRFGRGVAACFGENLRRARRNAGLSQEALGERASLHRTEVGLLERGARVPQLDTIIKLAGGLSISPSELVRGMTWQPGNTTTIQGNFELSAVSEPNLPDENDRDIC